MNKKIIITIAVALVVVGSAVTVYLVSQNAGAPSKTSDTSNKQAAATITYSNSGFSPDSVTVKSGETIAIKNTSPDELQFDSDPHPVHTGNTELNVGTVASGQTVTFTPTTKGTFRYHNHLNPGDGGSITVN